MPLALMRTSVGVVLLLCASLGRDASAATTWTWTFTSGTNSSCSPSCPWNNTRPGTVTSGAGTPSASAQAYASTGSTTQGSPANGNLETAYLGVYGANGLGINNRDGIATGSTGCSGSTSWQFDCGDLVGTVPEHAVDNDQRYESVLFSFGAVVDLKSVTLGYPPSGSGMGSDIIVLAYIGTGAPNLTSPVTTYSGLIGPGKWQVINAYGNVSGLPGMTANINPTDVSSQYWMIGTYIPGLGVNEPNAGTDYAKIAALGANAPPSSGKVPEPGSLGLAGLTIGALGLVRRLRKRGQAG